jgi:hypothetical protein
MGTVAVWLACIAAAAATATASAELLCVWGADLAEMSDVTSPEPALSCLRLLVLMEGLEWRGSESAAPAVARPLLRRGLPAAGLVLYPARDSALSESGVICCLLREKRVVSVRWEGTSLARAARLQAAALARLLVP